MTTTEQPTRKAPDKTPENDLSKSIDLLRSARAKCIRAGDEERAARILDAIGKLELIRDNKQGG